MFGKLLIANRGEIACRIMRTARRLGIRTVAVYSDADRDSLHRAMADEAFAIGPAPPARSYLAIDRILDACRATGAEAVHPGYGFLAENAAFAAALVAAGIAFIGPPPAAMRALGDKISAKRLAKEAGVSIVPGHTGAIADATEAAAIARAIGYPVMIKAAAGGGGKGMRTAFDDAGAREGFLSAANEARAAFGDDRVFIEKLIPEPRHIEIQILADAHGTCLSLGERECSIQRRHQKIIEEAPSPLLDDATRAAMSRQAVALARAAGYRSAGTIEFIVDAGGDFYFLEMNTRLQVEHPVTEFVTGLDIVEWMIRIAAGEPLPTAEPRRSGWAIECRVNAEDPFRNFAPSTGRLSRYLPPPETMNVRVDTGVAEGGEITPHYDPMIAKVIAYGDTRDQAICRMREALDEFHVRGVATNIPFLASVLAQPRFHEGRLSTAFIAEAYPRGFSAADLPHDDPHILVAVAASAHRKEADRNARISGRFLGHAMVVPEDWVVILGERRYPAIVRPSAEGFDILVDNRALLVRTNWDFGQPLFRGSINGRVLCVQIDRRGIGYRLSHAGAQADAVVLSPRAAELSGLMRRKQPPDLSHYLLSPMPGLLASVAVVEGQAVKAGEPLAVVEAMKMENVLKADRDVVVKRVATRPGESLSVDQVILEFEPAPPTGKGKAPTVVDVV